MLKGTLLMSVQAPAGGAWRKMSPSVMHTCGPTTRRLVGNSARAHELRAGCIWAYCRSEVQGEPGSTKRPPGRGRRRREYCEETRC